MQVRRLVSAVIADDLATLQIRLIEVDSVVNLWCSTVTVTDTWNFGQGSVEFRPAGTANIRAAAVGLVNKSDDQEIFDMIVFAGVGDLTLGVIALTTSFLYVLSVEPLL